MGYDYSEEQKRLQFPDVTLGKKSINRGKCVAGVRPGFNWSIDKDAKKQIYASLIPSTLRESGSVVRLGDPMVGHYIYNEYGTLFDSYLGVGQRLIDDNHPNLIRLAETLLSHNVLFRRESSTNDFILPDDHDELATPQKLSNLVRNLASKAFPMTSPYQCFLSSSGSEAVEAAIKIACRFRHQHLLNRYGEETERKFMNTLHISEVKSYTHPTDKQPVYGDYPFYFFVPQGAFHGRTLGALALTDVRPVQKRGFPAGVRVIRIPFNEDAEYFERFLDHRPLDEILKESNGPSSAIQPHKIPIDLVAGVVLEPFQGEGGYKKADAIWINKIASICKRTKIPIMVDEVQTFGRTGKVFASEHYDISPDIIAISKPSVVGITLCSKIFAESLPLGWHSNTWGGGRVFEVNYGFTVIDTFVNYFDKHFNGMNYLENSRVKGAYIEHYLEVLCEKYPRHFCGFSGSGCFWGLRIRDRNRFCAFAQRAGLKVLTVGVTEEISSVRALFLSDVLAKEIDCYCRLLEQVFAEMSI